MKKFLTAIVATFFLLALSCVALLSNPSEANLTDSDHEAISRQLAAWVLGDLDLRGNEQPLLDFSFFKEKNVILAYENCEVPQNLAEFDSNRSIKLSDGGAVRENSDTDGLYESAYITVSCLNRGERSSTYCVSVVFAKLGGQGYDFTITKDSHGLLFNGTNSWIS